MEAKLIDMTGWEQVGEGGTGKTYANQAEPAILLKLLHRGWEKSAENEYIITKKVYELGVPTAAVYDFVTDGERVGMTVEKLVGKRSFYRMISEDGSRLDEIAKRFAEAAKELHSISCDTSQFVSTKQRFSEGILSLEGIKPESRDKIMYILNSLEDCKTCLHGDLHAGNILDVAGKDIWIDLGDFGYGDPLLDISRSFLFKRMSEEKTMIDFHISKEQNLEFIDLFIKYYFGTTNPTAIEEINKKLQGLVLVQYAYLASLNVNVAQMLLPTLNRI